MPGASAALPGALAFGLPSYQEMMVLALVGLLIFGRRLPEVGRTVGRTIQQLRRGLQDFKDQLGQDEDLRQARSSIQDIRRTLEMPAVAADPKRLFEHLTQESLSSPSPEATRVPPPSAQSIFEESASETASPPAAPADLSTDRPAN